MTRILLAGATGLVGSQVLKCLAGRPGKYTVHVIARRPLESIPIDVQQYVEDPASWPSAIAKIEPDVAISCLGTTWSKAGKSEEAFRAVDLDMVLMFANAARSAGANHMISISSVGASAKSSNFYLSTKAEVENDLERLAFGRLDILRPGLLVGKRGGDRRLGERIAITASPFTNALLHGPLRRYRSIDSATVARAIASLAVSSGQGASIHENDAITALAG